MIKYGIGLSLLLSIPSCNSNSPSNQVQGGARDLDAISKSDIKSVSVTSNPGDSCGETEVIVIEKDELTEERLEKLRKMAVKPSAINERECIYRSPYDLEITYSDGTKNLFATRQDCEGSVSGVVDDEVLSDFFSYITPQNIMEGNYYYKKDDRGLIYAGGKALSSEAIADFSILQKTYAKSSNSAWYRDAEVKGVEAASFKALDENFASDSKNVYFRGVLIPDAKVADFAIQGASLYSTSQGKVLFEDKVVNGLLPSDITVLDEVHLKDSSNIWFKGKQIAGADVASFKIIECPEAGYGLKSGPGLICSPFFEFEGACGSDKNGEYLNGVRR